MAPHLVRALVQMGWRFSRGVWRKGSQFMGSHRAKEIASQIYEREVAKAAGKSVVSIGNRVKYLPGATMSVFGFNPE